MITYSEADIEKQFSDLEPLLEEWGKCVDSILQDYLDTLGFSIERIQRKPESRVKKKDSFIQKALYRGKDYANPIKDITDKVGTRVVLLNIDDVKIISSFISQCERWIVVEQSQDIDYIREHKPEEFGYQSNHFVVKPTETQYPKEQCDLLTCEIQVRTLLQHAYAETSHDTVYKSGHAEDPQVLRGLAVTMAFLETADDKIRFIYDKAQKVITKRTSLIAMITDIFRSYEPSFRHESYDAGMTEAFLALFDDSFVEQAKNELPDFVKKHDMDIRSALSKSPVPILYQQPVVILAFFCIISRQSFIIKNWPFSYDSLKMVIGAMGLSEDVLYS